MFFFALQCSFLHCSVLYSVLVFHGSVLQGWLVLCSVLFCAAVFFAVFFFARQCSPAWLGTLEGTNTQFSHFHRLLLNACFLYCIIHCKQIHKYKYKCIWHQLCDEKDSAQEEVGALVWLGSTLSCFQITQMFGVILIFNNIGIAFSKIWDFQWTAW